MIIIWGLLFGRGSVFNFWVSCIDCNCESLVADGNIDGSEESAVDLSESIIWSDIGESLVCSVEVILWNC